MKYNPMSALPLCLVELDCLEREGRETGRRPRRWNIADEVREREREREEMGEKRGKHGSK